MADTPTFSSELVHLARLALTGRRQDIQLYIRRLVRKLKSHPELAEQLTALLVESPTRQSPLRGETIIDLPIDQDSRLHLARYEMPSEPVIEPIWSPEIRQKLEQVVAERTFEENLHRAELLPTRSILFTGPPGVGKSLAARWIANKLQRPLVILDLAAVMSSFLGRTGNNVRHVLDYAKSVNCILFLDEFDAVAKRRDDATEIGELKRLVTVLLQEIDDWPSTGLLIAATNHPDLLDPAAWRRFEMVLNFLMPSDEQVQKAVCTFLGPACPETSTLHNILTTALHGLSFSDIEHELMHARREAVISGKTIEDSIQRLVRRRAPLLTQEARMRMALEMISLGYSQRQAHEWTGISRDTIRSSHRRLEPD